MNRNLETLDTLEREREREREREGILKTGAKEEVESTKM